jgi:hypothetical protein
MKSINNLLSGLDIILDKGAHYYVYGIVFLHALYILIFIGLVSVNQTYLRYLNVTMQLFVCVFLIIRFFPMRKQTLKEYDGKIIFGSATFLLMNLGFIEVARKFLPAPISNKLDIKTN